MGDRTSELYERAIKATTQEQADECLDELVKLATCAPNSPAPPIAMKIVRSNLGYFAGYHGAECRERVERLYRCEHPVFGPIARVGSPTTWEAFQLGLLNAKRPVGVSWITLEEFRQMPEHDAQPEEDKL